MLTESPNFKISIHEVFADLDRIYYFLILRITISIHEVFADLDDISKRLWTYHVDFNPRGLRRPRLASFAAHIVYRLFQSTRSSQTSTLSSSTSGHRQANFNPRGLRRPRRLSITIVRSVSYFNPRGLRKPRHWSDSYGGKPFDFNPRGLRKPRRGGGSVTINEALFQSTRSSQTSTDLFDVFSTTPKISIHEVFANLDATSTPPTFCLKISIHEVFANLDRLPKGYFKYLYDFNPRGLRKPRHSKANH